MLFCFANFRHDEALYMEMARYPLQYHTAAAAGMYPLLPPPLLLGPSAIHERMKMLFFGLRQALRNGRFRFSELELNKLLRCTNLPKLQKVEEPVKDEGESRVDLPLPSVAPGLPIEPLDGKNDFFATLGLSVIPSRTKVRGEYTFFPLLEGRFSPWGRQSTPRAASDAWGGGLLEAGSKSQNSPTDHKQQQQGIYRVLT
ncbi:unnamed protein product [Nesidiocoris tenuis]|uniref:Uncharacterized protein n=1 Tax=Nesidiocoris tenuis TaxID=355587 RepID=A0A6H5HAC2_9HEMI|nr:unnamed protein product [Nesidiocoris tenuis]